MDAPSYACSGCGAQGVKLWRKKFAAPALFCASCAAEKEMEPITDLDSQGCHTSRFGGKTTLIGDYFPAIPGGSNGFYTCREKIPPEAKAWWENLPSLSS